MKTTVSLFSIALVGMCVIAIRPARADDAAQLPQTMNAERLFTLNVRPLLESKCFGCHGNDADDLKGELDTRSREALLIGGESEEPAIVPGMPKESPLYQAVLWAGLEMPPRKTTG